MTYKKYVIILLITLAGSSCYINYQGEKHSLEIQKPENQSHGETTQNEPKEIQEDVQPNGGHDQQNER